MKRMQDSMGRSEAKHARALRMVVLVVTSGVLELAMNTGAARAASDPTASGPPKLERASRQETTGVVTGLAIGAVAGGPIGAIFGAAAGAWFGDRYHRKEVERRTLAASLDASEGRRDQLGIEMQRIDARLAETEARSARFASTVELSHELETTVGFRTGESAVSEESAAALEKLGALLASLPDAKARVAGFADARGPNSLNLELSQQRATAVAAVLERAGVERERLVIEAYGASLATADPSDVDGDALERRVTVTLEPLVPAVARSE